MNDFHWTKLFNPEFYITMEVGGIPIGIYMVLFIVFAETGYIAENLVVPSFNLNKTGTPEWQNEYLKKITQLCQDKKAKMLIWFCHKDYDAAIETIQDLGLYQDLFLLWRDTGFIDQNGNARPSFYTWKSWLNKTKTE